MKAFRKISAALPSGGSAYIPQQPGGTDGKRRQRAALCGDDDGSVCGGADFCGGVPAALERSSINSCTLVDNVVKFPDRCGKAAFGLLNDSGWMKEGERIMGKIKVTTCEIEGLYVIEPTVFKDERGYFMETYNQNDFKEAGLNMTFVQDNQSMSVKGVLRGLHSRSSILRASWYVR